MSMREILGTLSGHYTDVGLESAGVAVEEKEYGYFLEMTAAQLETVQAKYDSCKKDAFLEAKLPCHVDDMKARVREYYDTATGAPAKREYTVKKYNADGPAKTKLEEDNEIGEFAFVALLSTAKSFNTRIRISIPVINKETGEVRKKRDGSDLCWELDIYNTKAGSQSLWVKLEMEVDVVAAADIKQLIPFEYTTVIDADSSDSEEREFIGHLYGTEYNLR